MFIIALTLGAGLFTTVVVLLLPNKFTADALLMPPGAGSMINSGTLGQLDTGGSGGSISAVAGMSLGLKSPGDLYLALFRSRTVEYELISRFGLLSKYRVDLPSAARKQLESHSKVSLGPKDGLITVSVTDRDAKFAAELANGYVDAVKNMTKNLAIGEAAHRGAFFEQQLKQANQELAAAEEALRRTENSTGVLQVDSQVRSLIESAASMRAQVAAKEIELQAMRSYATDENREVILAKEQLSALREQLARLGGTESDANGELIVPKGNISQAGMEYVRRLRDVRYYETKEQLILRQFEFAKMDEAKQGGIIQVVDPAIPPDHRSSPTRTIDVLVMTILGFLGACIYFLCIDLMYHGESKQLSAR
jgi:uncharacterized protein involved in exopolysaccharide biosynthesis